MYVKHLHWWYNRISTIIWKSQYDGIILANFVNNMITRYSR